MTVKLEDRPIEQVREETIDRLIYNYSHGVISAEAFERRLDQAMKSECHNAIQELAADLEMDVDQDYTSKKDRQFTPNYAQPQDEAELSLKNVLGSLERSGQWQVPKKIKLFNILGSSTLDFTDAVFHHQNVTIELTSCLASDEIYVPENVNVVCKTFGIVSSIENKAPSVAQRQAPVITIEGKSVMSSLEIKVKRTIKEKFMALAEQMKEAFQSSKLS